MQTQATTITQKGQVTIPVKVRRLLNLRTGDQVKFVVTPKKEVKIKAAKRVSIMHLYGSLKPRVKVPKFKNVQDLIKWESNKAHEEWAKEANK